MCNRLHCTPAELDEMDAGTYAVFLAFMEGEVEGAQQKAQEAMPQSKKR